MHRMLMHPSCKDHTIGRGSQTASGEAPRYISFFKSHRCMGDLYFCTKSFVLPYSDTHNCFIFPSIKLWEVLSLAGWAVVFSGTIMQYISLFDYFLFGFWGTRWRKKFNVFIFLRLSSCWFSNVRILLAQVVIVVVIPIIGMFCTILLHFLFRKLNGCRNQGQKGSGMLTCYNLVPCLPHQWMQGHPGHSAWLYKY